MDDSVDEFVVSSNQVKVLEKTQEQIQDRFAVLLTMKKSDDFDFVWIKLRGALGCIKRCKAYIKALCNPEHQEVVDFVDLPLCVILGLQRFWTNWIEYSCGAVIDTSSKNKLSIQGSQLNVTKSVSMLMHMKDMCSKNHQNLRTVDQFDEIVRKCKDPFETDLIGLKSGVKKVLLDMIENAGKSFNISKIQQENVRQSEAPIVFATPKRSSILSSAFQTSNEASSVGKTPIQISDHTMAGVETMTEPASTSSTSTAHNHKEFRKPVGPQHKAQCEFFKHTMSLLGYEERFIDKVLSDHGPAIPPNEASKIITKLREAEKDKAFLMTDSQSKSKQATKLNVMDTIVISDDETDRTDENDSIIFVSETRPTPTQNITDVPMKNNEKPGRPDLPQAMVIETWLELNYEVTNDESDGVYKHEMLAKFRNDFNIADHPDLPNEFYSKISQTVFDRDPKYSKVKTKGASGKSGKRRLVCIRAKNQQKSPFASKKTTPPDNHQPSTSSNLILKDWINSGSGVTPPSRNPPAQRPNDVRPKANDVTTRASDVAPLPPPVFVRPMPSSSRFDIPSHVGHVRHPSYHGMMGDQRFPPRRPPPQNARPPFDDVSNMSTREILNFPQSRDVPGLRPIVIDGSNVACGHGNGRTFSCRGIAICVRYFWSRGHRNVTCFVPNFRKGSKGNPPTTDQFVLYELEKRNIAKFTPSREVHGRPLVCYDDRFIVQLAATTDGVIVSNDQYRDLMGQNPAWAHAIETRLLMHTWVGDIFMPPEDPLGRNGPPLDRFLALERPHNPYPPPGNSRRYYPNPPHPPSPLRHQHQPAARRQGSSPGKRSAGKRRRTSRGSEDSLPKHLKFSSPDRRCRRRSGPMSPAMTAYNRSKKRARKVLAANHSGVPKSIAAAARSAHKKLSKPMKFLAKSCRS